MHSALGVLSLTPDSIAGLGDLDAAGLSDLWGVFTKCGEALQNGRRLENLSWRLWFESGRREKGRGQGVAALHGAEEGWSDPEWGEATDSDSDESDREGRTRAHHDLGKPVLSATDPSFPPPATRPSPPPRGNTSASLERRSPTTITGGSLQRMITEITALSLTTLPPSGSKLRTGTSISSPPLAGPSTSPHAIHLATDASSLPTPSPRITVDARTQTTPSSSHRPSPMRSPIALQQVSHSSLVMDRPSTSGMNRSNSKLSTARLALKSSSTALFPQNAVASTSTSTIPRVPSNSERLRQAADAASEARALQLSFSTSQSSLGPRSLVKGFDTTTFECRPQSGNIAPPPTPAPGPSATLASPPPPSAMKSANKLTSVKKIFFISSPASDSDEDQASSSRSYKGPNRRLRNNTPQQSAPNHSSPLTDPGVPPPPAPVVNGGGEDDWNDEEGEEDGSADEEDDDDASSGWGSEYSTESEVAAARAAGNKPERERPQSLFAKRPSTSSTTSELKPRPPGLLSQLFHPGLMLEEGDRSHSAMDMRATKALPAIQTSKSAGLLTEQLRNKSFLRGAPVGTEMDSSSEEEEEDSGEEEEERVAEQETSNGHAVATALARHALQQIEAAGPIAPPQTPRTTRRAMLATELSESLRRNLLWERQTRNRAMGGPVQGRFQSTQNQPQPPPSYPPHLERAASARPNQPSRQPSLAPHIFALPTDDTSLQPTKSAQRTKSLSPVPAMVRRHTTGTGLYLAAQQGWAKGRGSGSDVSEGDEGTDVYGSAALAGQGVSRYHISGW